MFCDHVEVHLTNFELSLRIRHSNTKVMNFTTLRENSENQKIVSQQDTKSTGIKEQKFKRQQGARRTANQ